MTNTPTGYNIHKKHQIPQQGIYNENIKLHKEEIILELNNSIMDECPCCSGKHKERDEKEFKDLMNRLKRIEGQVRGVENMLENNVYCTDILIQVSAINSALNSFNKVLLGKHIKTCVAENIRNGNDDVIDELMNTLQKLMK